MIFIPVLLLSYFVAVQKSLSHLHTLCFLCVQWGFNPLLVSEHVNRKCLLSTVLLNPELCTGPQLEQNLDWTDEICADKDTRARAVLIN